MTENFQDKLHQEECNYQKVQKFVQVLEENFDCEKCSKTFSQVLARQNMQN